MMTVQKKRLVILISGRGSNMSSLVEAAVQGQINADVVAVISNKPSAQGLASASAAGIATAVVDHTTYADRETFDRALYQTVSSFEPDFVILAGFMRILTGDFVRPLTGRLINIHPSLLPRYPGLNTHQRAIDAGDKTAGATVHFVTEELDGGPAIIQAPVSILENDTADDLAARILTKEHQIYIEAVKLLCEGRICYGENGRVYLDGEQLPETGIVFRGQ